LHDFLDELELEFLDELELELLDELELELLDELELELLELFELEFELELPKATARAVPRSPRVGCDGCPAAGTAAATDTTSPVAPSLAAWLVQRFSEDIWISLPSVDGRQCAGGA
jgi:hypothetical protein